MTDKGRKEQVTLALFKAVAAAGKLETLSDTEVAALLEDHIWAHMSMLSIEGEVVSSAIDRLRRAGLGPMPSGGSGATPDKPDAAGFYWCETHDWEQREPCPDCKGKAK